MSGPSSALAQLSRLAPAAPDGEGGKPRTSPGRLGCSGHTRINAGRLTSRHPVPRAAEQRLALKSGQAALPSHPAAASTRLLQPPLRRRGMLQISRHWMETKREPTGQVHPAVGTRVKLSAGLPWPAGAQQSSLPKSQHVPNCSPALAVPVLLVHPPFPRRTTLGAPQRALCAHSSGQAACWASALNRVEPLGTGRRHVAGAQEPVPEAAAPARARRRWEAGGAELARPEQGLQVAAPAANPRSGGCSHLPRHQSKCTSCPATSSIFSFIPAVSIQLMCSALSMEVCSPVSLSW